MNISARNTPNWIFLHEKNHLQARNSNWVEIFTSANVYHTKAGVLLTVDSWCSREERKPGAVPTGPRPTPEGRLAITNNMSKHRTEGPWRIRCLKVRMNLSQALHRLQKSQLQLGNLRWAEEPLFFFFSFAFVILGGGNVQETGDCCQLWHNQQEGRWRSESLESKLFLMEFVVRWATWRAPPLSLGTRIVGRRNINGERPLIGSSGITLYYNADHVIPPCLVTLV